MLMNMDMCRCNIFLTGLMAIILLSSGCQKNLEEAGFINLQPEYEIFLNQELTPEGGKPALLVKTISEVECANSFISYQNIKVDDLLTIRLNSVSQEGTCVPDPIIIEENINLDIAEGSQNFNISLRDVVDNPGTIQSNILEISLNLESNFGFKISRSRLQKIQKNMVWGYFHSDDPELLAVVQNSISDLSNGLSVAKGDYGFFYVSPEENVVLHNETENTINSFLISTDVSFEYLIDMVEALKEEDSSFSFHATNYDGREINIL